MTKPVISIITPAYNVEQFLSETIDSVIGQTESRFEYFIVDDGSTDATLDIANRAAAADDRIEVIAQANSGSSAARNAALRLATADFVAFIDGDDVWEPTFVSTLLAELTSMPSSVRAVFCSSLLVTEDGTPCGSYDYPARGFDVTAMLAFWCPPGNGSSLVLRRSAFDGTTLFAEDLFSSVDLEMWMRILAAEPATEFVNIPQRLVRYRKRVQGSITSNSAKRVESMLHICRRYRPQLTTRAYIESLRRPGLVAFRNGLDEKGFEIFRSALPIGLVLYPFSRDGLRLIGYAVMKRFLPKLEAPLRNTAKRVRDARFQRHLKGATR